MTRVTLMLLAIVAVACPALADDQPSELKADEAYGVLHAEERVIDLPADQGKWHISVVGNPCDAKYQTVKGWFDSHPSLQHLKAQTHFHPIATTSTMYRDRYAKNTPGVPCVRIQSADGKVMYQVCGQDIPMSADALDQAIRSELFRRRRCCPQPQPQPQPEPQPQPDPAPQPLDHVGPPDVAPEPTSGLPPWWALVGLGVLTADWCQACQRDKPKLADLRRRGIEVVEIDYDARPDLVRKYRVRRLPTYIVLKDGKEVERTEDIFLLIKILRFILKLIF